jgi:large subunit ribosomal protein L4
MEINILNIKGKYTGRKILLDKSIFCIYPNKHAIYLEIKRYNALQRQGTHKSKERGDVTGSTRKLHSQKGTGRSRKGDIRNPLFRGGGRIFGSIPRNYNQKLNKSIKLLAKKSILSQKQINGQLKIVEDFYFNKPNTSVLINIFNNLDVYNKKVLLILKDYNKNIYLSSRNLIGKKVITINELNSYDLINYFSIIFLENAIKEIKINS